MRVRLRHTCGRAELAKHAPIQIMDSQVHSLLGITSLPDQLIQALGHQEVQARIFELVVKPVLGKTMETLGDIVQRDAIEAKMEFWASSNSSS